MTEGHQIGPILLWQTSYERSCVWPRLGVLPSLQDFEQTALVQLFHGWSSLSDYFCGRASPARMRKYRLSQTEASAPRGLPLDVLR
jgi:hypothetical protein